MKIHPSAVAPLVFAWALTGSCLPTLLAANPAVQKKSAQWQDIRGVNFFTSNASNAHEMWLKFDATLVKRELGWAKSLGFNSLRVWLSTQAYFKNPQEFSSNLIQFLDLSRKEQLTVMLVLFDCCGIEARPDAQPMTVKEAYLHFLGDSGISWTDKELIKSRYQEFAEGRGKDMRIPVGKATPFDILFWQSWTPNPGLSQMDQSHWQRFERYADEVFGAGIGHPAVIAFDLVNEPGCLFDFPKGIDRKGAEARVHDFINHFAAYTEKKYPDTVRTIGCQNVGQMKSLASHQTVLSFHSYLLGTSLRDAISQAVTFSRSQNKPLLLTECLANTDNWLKRHGEERLSSDEAQLQHYEATLPILLNSGIGWYSWGFVIGGMFTPFTDILYPNGYRRPAAVYLEKQLKGLW